MTAEIRTFSRRPWTLKGADATVVSADGDTIGSLFTFGTEDRWLIAAAPDLYEAVIVLAQITHQTYHSGDPLDCARGTCTAARVVIATADGRG